MSWYADPELFLYFWDSSEGYSTARIVTKYNVPIGVRDLYRLVVYWDHKKNLGVWSTQVEELTSIVKSLPTPEKLAEKLQLVRERNSELVAEITLLKDRQNNEVTNLQNLLNEEKNSKQASEKIVHDLTAKLEECRGAGGGSGDMQPWISSDTVPSHWVAFEELDVLNLPKNVPVTIMEEPSKPKLVKDVTTNVNRFYRGLFIVAVNVQDLIPDNEKARFDPDIWGLYKNTGVTYAARKLLKSEM
ncbi:hypothetical protein MKW94_030687 [Papaver nudicaule]|uniref:Uncharacterized protein n=1 Tax=Papaver nudicaule TaxID=74823 RepID=A0AA41S6R7_PAPNU|nr:hypothetical protein [Papaver nudicaule]